MKKRSLVPIAAVALVGLLAAFATTAQAFPTKTTACTGCHSGVNVAVTATLASTAGTSATYNFSSPGADSVVVFDGATKIFTFAATSGQFTVATGKTYTIYAVAGPGTGDGIGSTTVSPAAVVLDTTAPATVSNALSTYVASASVKLTATDAGSGVAATYYKLDGGAQVSGTTVNVTALGAHTIEFWSVDVAGNTETHKTASFSITAPVVLDTTAPVTGSDAKATYVASASVKLTATDTGSGVAATYYKLDGGAQVSGTTVNVTALGAHTIEFWSVDVAGNTETHKTASFSITAAVPVPTTDTYTVTIRISSEDTRGRVATLTNKVTGAKFTAIVAKKGLVVFTKVPAGTYTLSVNMKKGVRVFGTITVSAPDSDDDDDDNDSRSARAHRQLLVR